jgi:molecular chaperone HtpG
MRNGQLSIHSENILPIIKKWLYSEKDIFLRELAANASDAIQKLSILQAQGLASGVKEPRIDVRIDKENKTITVSDTGLGLDETEAETFLSQIAFSGAEEFIKTYQLNDTFIGHFGLGFFSAFMVADRVDVVSRSYKADAKSIIWKSDGSSAYTIEEGTRAEVGTDVVLHIGKEHEEYLEDNRLFSILNRFCGFFPHPVFLNGKRINEQAPLWQKRPSDCTEKEYQELYRALYPFDPPPLFWVHLNVDYPFHVQGILFFPAISKEIDLSQTRVKLYCNRVFVSDDCKDILPNYLSMLRGVLDSPDIPLNVSRSHLQVDTTVRQLAQHIAKKVADALSGLFKNDRKHYEDCWNAYEVVVKLGMLEDEKFLSKVKDILIWKTATSNWKTTEELIRESEGTKSIVYCEPEQEKSPLVTAYTTRGIDVAVRTSVLDHPLMSQLEQNHQVAFRRIDAALDSAFIDSSKEQTILDADGRTEGAKVADFFRSALADPKISVEAKSLDVGSVPAIMTLDERERRFRDYYSHVSGKATDVKPKAGLVINTNSPLVQAAYRAKETSPQFAHDLAIHIWDITRLTHKEMSPEEMHAFTERSTHLLEQLAQTALQAGT